MESIAILGTGLLGTSVGLALRAAAYRGQELFNTRKRTTGGGACQGCHSVQNVGTSAKGSFFNVGVTSPTVRADLL